MNKKLLFVIVVAIIALLAIVFVAIKQKQSREAGITKQQLLQKFQILKTQYDAAKAQGHDVSEVERLGREAKLAFDEGDYKKVNESLEKAIDSLRLQEPSKTTPTPSTISNVKVSVVYERINDARPKRTLDEQLQIFRETYTDMIFRASWRWNPQSNSCSEVPPAQKQTCIDSGYSFEDMKNTISEIKKQNPNIIIVGAIPTQRINKKEVNEITGETFDAAQTSQMALDPAKWGINSPTKEEVQKQLEKFSGGGYYPDITNPKYQELFLSWAKRQIDSGMDGVWIDLLYMQAGTLAKITNDIHHPAVKESLDAASKIVDEIHKYGNLKGKYIYVGSWEISGNFPYTPPKLDFVTVFPKPDEIYNKKFDEKRWDNIKTKNKEIFGDIPIFVVLDWGFPNSPIEIFSQKMDKEDRKEFLEKADEFFASKGMKFIYPVHGGNLSVSAPTFLAYGEYNWWDALAPEFEAYDTIKQLAQKKAKGE